MDMTASILGGFGLVLAGVRGLGDRLHLIAGPRMRDAVGHLTGGYAPAALTGTLLGAATQSTSAVTAIASSLVAAGLVEVRRALPLLAWANVGTAGLVLLAGIDLGLGALWLLGLCGAAAFLGLDRGPRAGPVVGAMLAAGLLFLGLALIRAGAEPLAGLATVRALVEATAGWLAPPFLLGLAVTLLAQSSSVVTILALTLGGAGLLGFEQIVLVTYGASLGSGLAVLLLMRQLPPAARQLALAQALFKAAGTVLFVALFAVEHGTATPLVMAASDLLADETELRIGLIFLAFQVVTALLVAPFGRTAAAALHRLLPAPPEVELARPAYLHAAALEDPATALDLVEREQARLVRRLPPLLDAVRDGGRPALPRPVLAAAGAALEREISHFLAELIARGGDRETIARAIALGHRGTLLQALRETVGEFAATAEAASRLRPDGAVAAMLGRMAESFHLLLLQLEEAEASRAGEDIAELGALAAARGEAVEAVRRRLAAIAAEGSPGQAALLGVTAVWERGTWLVGQAAALLAAGEARQAEAA